MSPVPKPRKLTVEEYFAIEAKAERKSEFFNGEMFLKAGASREHNILTRNLTAELHNRLRGGPCQVSSSPNRSESENPPSYAARQGHIANSRATRSGDVGDVVPMTPPFPSAVRSAALAGGDRRPP